MAQKRSDSDRLKQFIKDQLEGYAKKQARKWVMKQIGQQLGSQFVTSAAANAAWNQLGMQAAQAAWNAGAYQAGGGLAGEILANYGIGSGAGATGAGAGAMSGGGQAGGAAASSGTAATLGGIGAAIYGAYVSSKNSKARQKQQGKFANSRQLMEDWTPFGVGKHLPKELDWLGGRDLFKFVDRKLLTGKGEDQLGRDKFRRMMKGIGAVDDNYLMQFDDGTSFNIGIGPNDGLALMGPEDAGIIGQDDEATKQYIDKMIGRGNRKIFELDPTDPEVGQMIGLVNPLAHIIAQTSGGGGSSDEHYTGDIAGSLYNAIRQGGQGDAKHRMMEIYSKLGLDKDALYEQIGKLEEDGKIDKGKGDAFRNAVNETLDPYQDEWQDYFYKPPPEVQEAMDRIDNLKAQGAPLEDAYRAFGFNPQGAQMARDENQAAIQAEIDKLIAMSETDPAGWGAAAGPVSNPQGPWGTGPAMNIGPVDPAFNNPSMSNAPGAPGYVGQTVPLAPGGPGHSNWSVLGVPGPASLAEQQAGYDRIKQMQQDGMYIGGANGPRPGGGDYDPNARYGDPGYRPRDEQGRPIHSRENRSGGGQRQGGGNNNNAIKAAASAAAQAVAEQMGGQQQEAFSPPQKAPSYDPNEFAGMPKYDPRQPMSAQYNPAHAPGMTRESAQAMFTAMNQMAPGWQARLSYHRGGYHSPSYGRG